MAQDLTTRVSVLGQNPDGSLNVRMDSGNPFAAGGGAMTAYNPGTTNVPPAYKARIGNVEVQFASEADMLKAQMALAQLSGTATPGVPQLLGGGGVAGGLGAPGWVATAANAASALNNYFVRSNLDRKVSDYDRALTLQRAGLDRLASLQTKYPDLVPVLQDIFGAERTATETGQSALEDLVSAQGIATGVDAARVAADFLTNNQQSNTGGLFSGGGSGALLAGGAGLAVGLLASRSSNNSRR